VAGGFKVNQVDSSASAFRSERYVETEYEIAFA